MPKIEHLVVLMMGLEEEFRTEFSKEEQASMRTLADVRRIVESHLSGS